ncbi:hypothetical protein [Hydrogenimonas sp.]
MFSTMQNQKKAEELIEDAKRMISAIDEKFEKKKEKLEKKISEIDAIRSNLIARTLGRFRKRFETIENEQPIELPPIAETPLSAQLEHLYKKADIPPVKIKDVGGGKGSAFFVSLIAAILTVVAALGIGAVGTGQPLVKETFVDMAHLEKILIWLSGGAFDPNMGNPAFGAVVLAIAAIAAWSITWSIMMGKTAKRNLESAKATYAEAEEYHEKRNRYAETIETLTEELALFENILQTCDIYMQEYNAILQRIIFTEGTDYDAYRNVSKDTVKRAAECAESLIPLLNIAIVTTEGTPSQQLSHAIEHGRRIVAALLEERAIPSAGELADTSEEKEEVISLPPKENEEESLDIERSEKTKIV